MVDIIPIPPETDEQKIARLENGIAACLRNNALLNKGIPQIAWNNGRLRSGLRDLIDGLPADEDLEAVAEKLEDALLIPFRYQHEYPEPIAIPDDEAPEDAVERISFLEERLRTFSRTNYLVQLAGTPIVWNSDAIRDVMRELIRELDPPAGDDGPENPTTVHTAIIEKLKAVLKEASD